MEVLSVGGLRGCIANWRGLWVLVLCSGFTVGAIVGGGGSEGL